MLLRFLVCLIPWFHDALMSWFLHCCSMFLRFFASVIQLLPCFFDSLMRRFLDASIPSLLDSLNPWFLWNLCLQMPPFTIVYTFIREVGGCWQGLPPWNSDGQWSPKSRKNHIFSRPRQRRLRAIPISLFHWIVLLLGSFLDTCISFIL